MSALPSKPAADVGATREQVLSFLELLETRMSWSIANDGLHKLPIHHSAA